MERRRGLHELSNNEKLEVDKSVLDKDSSDAFKALREALNSLQDGVLGRYERLADDSSGALLKNLADSPLNDLQALLSSTASEAQRKTALALLRRLLERPTGVDRAAQTTLNLAEELDDLKK